MARAPLRLKIAIAILGGRAKEFIPPISGFDGWSLGGRRLNNYTDKRSQLEANVGWCFTATNAILDPTAAVPLKLKRVKKDGEREDVTSGSAMEIMGMLDAPNLAHTGEQFRQLHLTYMNDRLAPANLAIPPSPVRTLGEREAAGKSRSTAWRASRPPQDWVA